MRSSTCCLAQTTKTSIDSRTRRASSLSLTLPGSPWIFLAASISFFVGGRGRRSQTFNRTAATNTSAMLFLAVVALVMPAVFDLTLYGTLTVASVVVLLAVGTLLTTVQAELLVGALEPALKQFGFTELFVGVVLVAPAVVLYSFAIGHPMSLIFHPFELTAIALSVFAIIAFAFYFIR